MTRVPEEHKRIAHTLAAAFGGSPQVRAFYDDDKSHQVDIVSCVDRPQSGVTSYGTIGTSDSALYLHGKKYAARVELVGACSSTFKKFPNVLATAAFNIVKSGWFCGPGVIFPDAFRMYRRKGAMAHVMFTSPFLWEDSLKTLKLPDRQVAWLLAVPISDAERQFACDRGPSRLEDVFVERQIDVFDPDRPSES